MPVSDCSFPLRRALSQRSAEFVLRTGLERAAAAKFSGLNHSRAVPFPTGSRATRRYCLISVEYLSRSGRSATEPGRESLRESAWSLRRPRIRSAFAAAYFGEHPSLSGLVRFTDSARRFARPVSSGFRSIIRVEFSRTARLQDYACVAHPAWSNLLIAA